MVPSTDVDDDCPDVDWEHELQPGQCVSIHIIVEVIYAMKIVELIKW